jgi:hypothetical protein
VNHRLSSEQESLEKEISKMNLKVIGAGLGRTATSSLKRALEQLLNAPCYHMSELMENSDHNPIWHQAAFGNMPDWHSVLPEYVATVDWPAAAFYPELSVAFPEALVILSTRSAESWWDSARQTIYAPPLSKPSVYTETMGQISVTRFPIHPIIHTDKEASLALFEDWNRKVIELIPAERLLVWQASDGWGPICQALQLPVPDELFPYTNTKKEFRARVLGKD